MLALDDLLTRWDLWGVVVAVRTVGLLGFLGIFMVLMWTAEVGFGRASVGLAIGLVTGALVYAFAKVVRRQS